MLYLNQEHLNELGIRWSDTIDCIGQAIAIGAAADMSQPIKPYLRYGDLRNRIIAMPAYIGGGIHLAGIKWIASFPGNLEKGLARAHAVMVLNDADTGVPVCVINTALISTIRTASVTGWVLAQWLRRKGPDGRYRVGICGFGPIGQQHLTMLQAVLGHQLVDVYLYDIGDIRPDTLPRQIPFRLVVCATWQEAYTEADIFITCTVSTHRYIDLAPKKGSLHLNVSLRDYQPTFLRHVTRVIVDSWDEVCRQDTDVERMHHELGLQQADTLSLGELLAGGLDKYTDPDAVFMFNPMGMAIFDMAVAGHYHSRALAQGVGQELA
ncbi:2,3-diaminopropionate biosynthesis protein SbnB [Fibrella aquatilis]|uniref:2,3-diaminopropionate biosynthesis protein SbnB n=1 Tax=Fibrella aquatilis TaxID=2817059 RepID=A0A939G9A3_9BACT|nr:2,3-diaminopropionate biosynthesis protein SbnB [Fibrella aquatilis]MBO0933583.1 2,3-diaminopropionate biosynthesis protein SbnB [Fibrella aquatilis]